MSEAPRSMGGEPRGPSGVEPVAAVAAVASFLCSSSKKETAALHSRSADRGATKFSNSKSSLPRPGADPLDRLRKIRDL